MLVIKIDKTSKFYKIVKKENKTKLLIKLIKYSIIKRCIWGCNGFDILPEK